jgi:hypothetical protein
MIYTFALFSSRAFAIIRLIPGQTRINSAISILAGDILPDPLLVITATRPSTPNNEAASREAISSEADCRELVI